MKNNTELSANVGNMYHRILSFIAKNLDHKIPPYHEIT